MRREAWLVRSSVASASRLQPRLRLYCFPYSGGNAVAFIPWQRELAADIELCAVQLPGRGARFAEPALTCFDELICTLAQVVQARQAQSPLPFVFYGHSLGSLMAFELAHYLRDQSLPLPQQLLLSGCNPPPLPGKARRLHELSDAELIERLRSYNGTPAEILDNPEMMALLLPTIRADFALGADYQDNYRPAAPLPIPFKLLAGRNDPHVNAAQLRGWQQHTSSDYQEHWFEGGHFFINESRRQVLDCLAGALLEKA